MRRWTDLRSGMRERGLTSEAQEEDVATLRTRTAGANNIAWRHRLHYNHRAWVDLV